ncbi:MAG: heavy metal translocating P-type ATPase, partial [Bacteroidetes bacterium HGW-Bacteroidetes-9]
MIRENIVIDESTATTIAELEAEAYSITLFASREKVLAIAAISDQIRESSKEAVAALKAMHVEVIMLTGDHEIAAKKVSETAGIEIFKAGLTPEDKADYIKSLQAKGKKVAMAGDGINDTIALATANTGIAMGSGSDASIETAAITITGTSLNQIVETIKLSRNTNRIIKQNLFWAFFYNLLALPLAAGVFYPLIHQLLNPMIASAAMAFSSVSVVTNSLRIRKS